MSPPPSLADRCARHAYDADPATAALFDAVILHARAVALKERQQGVARQLMSLAVAARLTLQFGPMEGLDGEALAAALRDLGLLMSSLLGYV